MKNSIFFHIFLLLLTAITLTGCIKDEKAVAPHDPGNVVTVSADMNEDYKWQLYYHLQTQRIVGRNLRTDWDLGLEASPGGYHVILNAARMMAARELPQTELAQVSWQDTTGFGAGKKADHAAGSLDSTAIGDWRGKGKVYLVANNEGDFYKVQFQEVSTASYRLRFSNMKTGQTDSLEVVKDSAYNFAFVSLKERRKMQVEPPKKDWDLAFSVYTHYFPVEQIFYSVTGCLLNRYQTTAVADSTVDFASITYNDLMRYQFSSDINTIGYDWKEYSFATGSYVVFPRKNYVVRTAAGKYFKLHFIDFNKDGVKGNPRWEQQEL